MVTRYVNPDSSGGDGTTNATSGANAAYASLSAAEAALPATLADTYEIVCETGGSANTSTVTFSGFTADSTNYLHVYTSSGHRHAGVYTTGKFRVEVARLSPPVPVTVSVAFTRLTGLQVKNTHATTGAGAISITAADCIVDTCICTHTSVDSGDSSSGVAVGSGGLRTTIRNLIAYKNRNGVFVHASASGCVVENCTLGANTGRGVSSGNLNALTVKNAYAGGSGSGEDYAEAGTVSCPSWTFTTCASSDSTSRTGVTASIAHSTANFLNVTAGSEDYHLQATASATLLTGGTDLSGSFTLDIDGETRSDWSIGADEIVAGGGVGTARPSYFSLLGVR